MFFFQEEGGFPPSFFDTYSYKLNHGVEIIQ
jgi:hypothetical protein